MDSGGAAAEETMGGEEAAVFQVEGAARFELVGGGEELAGAVGDEDLAGLAVGFETAGDVHGVAPDVVGEFARADDAGDERSGVDADAELPGEGVAGVEGMHAVEHGEGQ